MQQELPRREIVLLGAGHTHLHVIREWGKHALSNARLTCVSNHRTSAYSGMLTGTLAGDYRDEAMQIALESRCAATGVRLVVAETTGIDRPNRQLLVHDQSPISFDFLSIGIGSVPRDAPNAAQAVSVKPMQTFLARFDEAVRAAASENTSGTLRLAVVGAGAGGVELAFCAPKRIQRLLKSCSVETIIIDHHNDLLPGAPAGVVQKVRNEFERRGTVVHLGRHVEQFQDGQLTLAGGETIAADIVLWATSAVGPPALDRFGLPSDERGFLVTRQTLQSVADDSIFVVGDAGTCPQLRVPKAGVYAVRQGPYLWKNIRRRLNGRPMKVWKPQEQFLSLLNTGDGRAILSYRGVSAHARWCWKLKDFIDRRFIAKHQAY